MALSCLTVLTNAFVTHSSHINFAHSKYCPKRRTIRNVAQSSDVATEPITNRSQLEKMTVKELKVLMTEQGIPSRPGNKLKKDVVDCIWDYYQNFDVDTDVKARTVSVDEKEESVNTATQPDAIASAPKRKMPIKMPPVGDISATDGTAADDEEPYQLTPKDHIILKVLKRYPPLHDAIVSSCLAAEVTTSSGDLIENVTEENIDQCFLSTLPYDIPSGLAENDMRQTYHPMLVNATQSDLDIVFVGTASCAPGVSRGVSCTALRLNWRSKNVYTEGNVVKTDWVDKGTLGTWLFDAGECTQLSVQKTANIKPGKITKIFITHCHGECVVFCHGVLFSNSIFITYFITILVFFPFSFLTGWIGDHR